MNFDTYQNTGKTQWRWEDAYGRKMFSYSEHLLSVGKRGANGLVMLYYIANPSKVIVHIDHTSSFTDENVKEFIKRGFKIIGAKIEITGRYIDAFSYEHDYTDFVYEIEILDTEGLTI